MVAHPTALPLARATQHLAAHRLPEATGAFRAVLSIDPNEHRAYLGLADCAYARGAVDEAVDDLVGAALDYAERNLHEGAFALLTKALAFAPQRLELHIDIAELEAATGRIELAKARLRNLAWAYRQAGGFEEAEAVLEVVAGWEAAETTAENAAPELVRVDSTLPNLVGTDATMPEDAVDIEDIDDIEIDAVMDLMDVNDATEQAPPPPPITLGTPGAVQTVVAPAPSSPPVQVAQTLAPHNPARRGKAKREVKRWRPSSVTGAQDAVPSAVSQDRTVAVGGRPILGSAARPARPVVTPAPRPAKPSAPAAAPSKSTAAPAKSARRSSVITPAPSPKRGGLKLDKLPPREGPSTKPVAKRHIAAPPPVGTPQPVAPQRTSRYGLSQTTHTTVQSSEDETPTRLWCPSHLLLEPPRTST